MRELRFANDFKNTLCEMMISPRTRLLPSFSGKASFLRAGRLGVTSEEEDDKKNQLTDLRGN